METRELQPNLVSLDPINEDEFRKIQLYSVRKSLICIATLDFVLNFFSMLSATTITDETQRNVGIYTYLAICFMILLGVVGINRYNKYLVYFYAIYLGLELISRIVFSFYFSWNVFSFIFIWLIIFINIWILKLICKYIENLKNLPSNEIESLKSGWKPATFRVIYY
tara:strand:- start:58 stop:558 length:501 start_codon:yes stop_codon:yes gene_type:complete